MRRNPKIVSLSPPMQAAAGLVPNHGFSFEEAWDVMNTDEELASAYDDFDDFEAAWMGKGAYAAVFKLDDDTVLKLTTDEDDAKASALVAGGSVRVPRGLPRPVVTDGAVDGLVRVYDVRPLGVVHEEVDPQAVHRRGVLERDAMLYAIVAERTNIEKTPTLDVLVVRNIQQARLAFLASIDTHHSVDQVARDRRLTDEQRRLFDAMVNGFRFLTYAGIHVRDFHAGNWGWSAVRKQSVLIDLGHHASRPDLEPNARDPLGGQVMYHGTTAKFSEFKKEQLSPGGAYGAGFYFTNDRDLAQQYSGGGEPVAARLTLRRPWVVDLDLPYAEAAAAKRPFRTTGARERLHADGYDGVLVKQGDYLEAIVYDPAQIAVIRHNPETGGSFGGQLWSNRGSRMPRVQHAFEQVFAEVKERFPDFGAIELHQDERAGADNGVGSERQFGYCMSGDPQVIAFAAKTEKLPEANILGLMVHEFGHALDNRYGKELERMLGVKLPRGVELRADAIGKAAFGKTIKYDAHDVQCIGCRGTSPRPRRLGA